MKVEVPNLNDYEEINKIALQVHNLHVTWRPDLFLKTDEAISKERFALLVSSKEILIARDEHKIYGYICFSIKEKQNPIMRYHKILDIDSLAVDEENRSQGVGTMLLEEVKKIAKNNECTDLHLTVNEENVKAIKLYEKLGFRVKNISYTMDLR